MTSVEPPPKGVSVTRAWFAGRPGTGLMLQIKARALELVGYEDEDD